MNNITRLKRVVIKEEMFLLTGDAVKAIILNQMIYWSERIRDFDKFINEEKKRASNEGIELDMEPQNGWIYKSSKELAEEIMICSDKTVNRHLSDLVANGYLEQRTNPKYHWDRTYQYRVNLVKIARDLLVNNYTLEGYRLPLEELFKEIKQSKEEINRKDNLSYRDGRSSTSTGQIEKSNIPGDEVPLRDGKSSVSIGQNEELIPQVEDLIPQNERAIPEITYRDYLQNNNNDDWVSLESHPGVAEVDSGCCCLPGAGQTSMPAERGKEGSYAPSKQERDITKLLGQNDQILTPKVLEKETRPTLTTSRTEGRNDVQFLPAGEIMGALQQAAAGEEDTPSLSGPQVLTQVLNAQLQLPTATGRQVAVELLANYSLPDILGKIPVAVAEIQVRPIHNLKQFLSSAVEKDWQVPVAVPAAQGSNKQRPSGREDKYKSLYRLGSEH